MGSSTTRGRRVRSIALGLAAGVAMPALVLGGAAAAAPNDQTNRVSTDSAGAQSTSGTSVTPSISADGRYIAFMSLATDLVAGDTNTVFDIFVKDRATGVTTRVNTDSAGAQATGQNSFNPAISADGRYVTFSSSAANLVAGDTNNRSDIFVKDRVTGATTRVSTDSAGGQEDLDSNAPSISADGRYVAFESNSTNLVPSDTNTRFDVFVKDRVSGATTRVSTDSSGAQASDTSGFSSISGDGRSVAFQSDAANLVAGDTNATTDVFVKNLASGATTRVSTDSAGTQATGGISGVPSLSGDGRSVAFTSDATNLVTSDTNILTDVFVKDLGTGVTTRVSTDSAAAQATGGNSIAPSLSADGRSVAFRSDATNLVTGDTNTVPDVFVKDLGSGATTRVSTDSAGAQATGGNSIDPSLSADGRYVAFQSDATNLVPADTNGFGDVFVHTRALPTVSCATSAQIAPGASGDVPIGGSGFTATPSVTLGDGVVVNSVTVNSATSLTAHVSVAGSAAVSPRNATVTNPAGDSATGGPCLRVAPNAPTGASGYRMVAGDGGIFTFGDRVFHGSTGDIKLNKPIVGGATDQSTYDGYWIVASDGGVFTFNAPFFGSLGNQVLASPAVEIEPTPSGQGYWIVLANGKVHPFGDAQHFGDMSGRGLNKPMIGMAVTPSGLGYWLVAEDGGIFNFGDAGFFGSMGATRLNAPVIDLAPAVDNNGYYLVAKDGGVFTFGSADFKGSTGSLTLNAPVIAMLVAPNGAGYWMAATDGGVFTFGAIDFLGSMGGTKLNSPVLDLIN